MSMSAASILQYVNTLEERHPIDEWHVGDVQIWPLVRIRLATAAYKHLAGNVFTGLDERPARAPLLLRALRERLRDRRMEDSSQRRANVLIVSDGVVTVPLHGQRIEVVADPLADLLRAEGREPLTWLTTYASAIPRSQPSARVQLWMDFHKARGTVAAALATKALPPGYREFLADASSLGLPSASVGPEWLVRAAGRLASLRDGIVRRLRRIGPCLVAVNCYYSLQNMALIAACRRLKIPSMDLQHGVQGPLHVAYGPWKRVPGAGWDLLPDRFWCWSETEAAGIRSWACAGAQERHLPLIGGNPWLELWRTGESPLVREMGLRVAQLCAQRPGRKRVLVSLQWGMSDAAYLLPLRDVIAAADPDLDWWVRLHPLMGERKAEIEKLLQGSGSAAISVTEPTELPLLALLRAADVHATYSSSVVLEAAELGVASVVSGEFGQSSYADLISKGRVFLGEPSQPGFKDSLRAAAALRDRSPPAADGRGKEALRELLARVCGRTSSS